MLLLGAAFDPSRTRGARRLWAPGLLAAAAALALVAIGLALEQRGSALPGLGWAGASGAVHAGFIALGWLLAREGRSGWQGPALRVAVALLVASLATRLSDWGALAYLLPPALLLRQSQGDPALRGIGCALPAGPRPSLLGLAAGTFLGLHLVITASLTFGYAVRVTSVSHYLAAVAYDVGANAVSAEWLFRGALFSLGWRRWEFWRAAAVSTSLAVARYLLDPALPHTAEVAAGTVFYMTLLGFSACALRAWSGSLVPGYLATVAFFAGYRMLAQ